MRRVKATRWVTGQFYRGTSAVVLVAAFAVAMIAGSGPGELVSLAPLPAAAAPAIAAAPKGRQAGRGQAVGRGMQRAEAPDDSDAALAVADDTQPPVYLGAIARLDQRGEVVQSAMAPLPGYARDAGADRPNPQQLERLIARSYVRSGSNGGGD